METRSFGNTGLQVSEIGLGTWPLGGTEVETTLRELRTEYVDLYQLHAPPEDPELRDRIIDEFGTLKDEGKIRHIGASIEGPAVTDATVSHSRPYVDTHRAHAL